jgi:hypothetical protein
VTRLDREFTPRLNGEHDAYAWIDGKTLVKSGFSPELNEQEQLLAIGRRLDTVLEGVR